MKKTGLSFEQIMTDLKKGSYQSIYFFTGEENYYIDKLTDFIIENALPENEKAFNQTIFYGKDTEAIKVIESARRFPMMAVKQLVVVKEAQEMKDFFKLETYIENPLKSTILVLAYKYKKADSRLKFFKTLKEKGVFFESEKHYDDKIPEWIAARIREKGYAIEPKAASLLTEFVGNDLSRLENEIEKLYVALPAGLKTITSELIERNIGISKEYNVFELQAALTRKDHSRAHQIVRYFASNPKNNHIIMVTGQLFSFFSKILLYHTLQDKTPGNVASGLKVHPFFAKDYIAAGKTYPPKKVIEIIGLLREYDLRSKGFGDSSTENGDLLKELVFKIMY